MYLFMVSLTISNLAMFKFSIIISFIFILAIIISFMFILVIIRFYIIGFAIKYLFISYFSHINCISG